MSNSLAIAAVTATLRRLLQRGVGETVRVTTDPPNKAGEEQTGERLNVYLYQLLPNPAWRNANYPPGQQTGHPGFPPLALNLRFLITAHAAGDSDMPEHRLLGRAMSVLHGHPVLSAEEVRRATAEDLAESDLHLQTESIRLTPIELSYDELTKMWGMFQTQHRLGVAYEASVVLIQSGPPPRIPLPVLRRGLDDRGPAVFPAPEPYLVRAEYRDSGADGGADGGAASVEWPAAEIGRLVTFVGGRLPRTGGAVILRDPKRPGSPSAQVIARLIPEPGPPGPMVVRIVEDPTGAGAFAELVAGLLSAAVEYPREPAGRRTTNAVPFALAPRLRRRSDGTPATLTRVVDERLHLSVPTDPPVGPRRIVELLLDGQAASHVLPMVEPDPLGVAEAVLFDVNDVVPGEYRIRLRVDGVESLSMVPDGAGGFHFDKRQKIIL